MKKIFTLLFLFVTSFAAAQQKLSKSLTEGPYTYIFKLTDKEFLKFSDKYVDYIDDKVLHTRIDSFLTVEKYTRKLPYGNYLYLKVKENTFDYVLHQVRNVSVRYINNFKKLQLSVFDENGKPVTDASVSMGSKKLNFDPVAQLYKANKVPETDVIKVVYQGTVNFFQVARIDNYQSHDFFQKLFYSTPVKYTWLPFRNLFKYGHFGINNYYYNRNPLRYKGYMVFSKPKYKPNDTLKFKVYSVKANGKALNNISANVFIESYQYKEKFIAKIWPYKDGGYTFEMVLSDTLKLQLDQDYSISLKDNKGRDLASGRFKYEAYELKSLSFVVRADKETHSPSDPVNIFMKATDENELPIADGRVVATLFTDNALGFYDSKIFIKDTLWVQTIPLDPVGETKFVLPDNIFPKADLKFHINFKLLNSNNESAVQTKYFDYTHASTVIKASMIKDSILVEYFRDGKSVEVAGKVTTSDYNSIDQTVAVQLPYKFKFDRWTKEFDVSAAGEKEYFFMDDFDDELSISATQLRDSLNVIVVNPRKLPFWYTIFSNNSILKQGYTDHLDTLFAHSGTKVAHVTVNYLWGDHDESRFKEVSSVYNNNRINMQVTAPDVIFPGQEVTMKIKVSDHALKPINAMDITAQAFTAKFKDAGGVDMPYFGRNFKDRKKVSGAESDDMDLNTGRLKFIWEKWGRQLGLDTIEYFHFTNPKDIYTISERTEDTITQIAPFVISNGKIEPVHILYINDVPVFFSQADQYQSYAFAIRPGLNKIEMRTAGHRVTINDFFVEEGKRTVLSVAAIEGNAKAIVVKAPSTLDYNEAGALQRYMFKITNNFSSAKAVLKHEDKTWLLNQIPFVSAEKELLIGPMEYNYLTFKSAAITRQFIKEQDYTFTFQPGFLKQKSYTGFGFSTILSGNNMVAADYKARLLNEKKLDSIFNEYLDLRSATTDLFSATRIYVRDGGKLVMELDSTIIKKNPYLKNVILYKSDEPDYVEIYPARVKDYGKKLPGIYRVMYLFKDNRYFVQENVSIKGNGVNYFNWKDVSLKPADSISTKIDAFIKSADTYKLASAKDRLEEKVTATFNAKYYDMSTFTETIKGTVADADTGEPVPGANVKIKGTQFSVNTDAGGRFTIKAPEKGKLLISYIGYETQEVEINKNMQDTIALKEDKNSISEVVVSAFGYNALAGKVAGVRIANSQAKLYETMEISVRGAAAMDRMAVPPLYIIDGLPFSGDISEIDTKDITETSVINASEAVAVYGASAAGGVVIIRTKRAKNANTALGNEGIAQQQTMRTNFSDVGFWQPKLITDEKGEVSFKVKFPDDITKWRTRIIAMNGNKQGGYIEKSIKSFKTLSANFVSPQFAIEGDNMNVIGKLMNYLPGTATVIRGFTYNDKAIRSDQLTFKNAHIDTIAVSASTTDSLKFEYTLQQEDYFDGERRKIPVFKQGVIETKGVFAALTRDTTVRYNFDQKLGKVTLRAESSVFPVLLDEIEKIRTYSYLCNEQLASKLKALLLEKTVRTRLNQEFKHEKDIKDILKLLSKNKRKEGTWGWWKDSEEELWISLHVVEALLQAEKQSYTIELDKNDLYVHLRQKLVNVETADKLYIIQLLKLLDDKIYIKDDVLAVERTQAKGKATLYDQLLLMDLKQQSGIKVNVDSLLRIKKHTMFGNSYWGEENAKFWDNSVQNTLLAYKILKAEGNHIQELDKIQGYFLEQRKDGQWRNTYESAKILSAILPELLEQGLSKEPASISLNGSRITQFPYDQVLDAATDLNITKTGNMPVYFTAYQQYHNTRPEKVEQDFTVKTSFVEDGKIVGNITGGKMVTLTVDVEVKADADYVMIEVPIPAGCSYENKVQRFWGVETHREYFKEKTSIFCTKLKQGKYTFKIDLMPRYGGNYTLNPAKAEMMYFPVFYGREGIKKVKVN